jgi:hypothetical protein
MLFKKLNWPRQKRGCVFFSHPECLVQLNGKWNDRFCDPIGVVAEELGQPATVLEYSSRMEWIRPTAQPRLDVTLVLALAKGFSLVMVIISRYRGNAKLTELDNLLHESGVEKYVSVADVQRLAAYVVCAKKLLTMVMRPWRFRLGFVCTYYSSSAMAFVMACRNLGIPVYDIQHGVQGDAHVAYRSWRASDGRVPDALPDGFWCWDAASAEQLKRWCSPVVGPKVVIGGDVWTEYVLNSAIDVVNKVCDIAQRRTVMVSLQPVDNPLPDILLQAMAAAPADVLWLVRLHPVMTTAFANNLIIQLNDIGCKNFLIQGNTDEPLPRQLLRTDLHVTLYSSVVIEAATLGVYSVLLDPRAVRLFRDIVGDGKAVLVQSAQELLGCLAAAKRTEHRPILEKRIARALQVILEDISTPI